MRGAAQPAEATNTPSILAGGDMEHCFRGISDEIHFGIILFSLRRVGARRRRVGAGDHDYAHSPICYLPVSVYQDIYAYV